LLGSPPHHLVDACCVLAPSEALVYYDDEAVYFECRGDDDEIVRFTFEMLKTLKQVVEDEE
jgi:hypothetical protein